MDELDVLEEIKRTAKLSGSEEAFRTLDTKLATWLRDAGSFNLTSSIFNMLISKVYNPFNIRSLDDVHKSMTPIEDCIKGCLPTISDIPYKLFAYGALIYSLKISWASIDPVFEALQSDNTSSVNSSAENEMTFTVTASQLANVPVSTLLQVNSGEELLEMFVRMFS